MYLRSLVGLVPVLCVVSSIYRVTVTVETLDRTLSRTRFGKDYSPGIIQSIE